MPKRKREPSSESSTKPPKKRQKKEKKQCKRNQITDWNHVTDSKIQTLIKKLEPRKVFLPEKGVAMIGIDYSINAPAMTIFTDTHFDIYYIRGSNGNIRVRDCKCKNFDQVMRFHPLVGPSKIMFELMDGERLKYYDYLSELFVPIIKELAKKKKIFIGIEGYSHQSTFRGQITNTFTRLVECQTILRSKLNEFPMYILSPKSIKKHFAANGNANKRVMAEAWLGFGFPDIGPPMGKKKMLEYKDSCKPMEDIVDSLAIALTLSTMYYTFQPESTGTCLDVERRGS